MKSKSYYLTKLKTMGALGIGLFLFGPSVEATDQALIDVLVKNGYLTEVQAEALSKEAKDIEFTIKGKKVEKVQFSGRLQIQYDNISVDDETSDVNDPSAVNSFTLRRIYLGAKVNLKNDWSGTIITRFNDNEPDLDKAYIAKKFEDGDFQFGMRKVNFGYEEGTSSSKIKAVERSMVTRYFVESPNSRRVGIGGRHTGVYVDGAWEDFGYGAGLTNGYHDNDDDDDDGNDGNNNELGFYGNLFYKVPLKGKKNKVETGLNLGYQPEGNTENSDSKAAVFGYNPYAAFYYDRFRLVTEFLGAHVEDGRQGGGDDADPWGINIIPSYKITDELELVFRFSYFDGDSRGMRISDGIRRANNPDGDPAYDEAQAYYLGFNWYIEGNDVKLSAGYEYADFSDRLDGSGKKLSGGKDAQAYVFRARLQLLF